MNRQVTIILGLLVVAAGIGMFFFLKSLAAPPEKQLNNGKNPVILARVIKNSTTPNQIAVSGKLMSDQRIEIFSEVQGVLLSSPKVFKEGVSYVKGERLLRIDSTEFYLNLMATKSSYLNMLVQLGPDIKYDFPEAYEGWNSYVARIDVKKPLPELPEPDDEKQKNFLTSRDVYNQYYSIKSQEEKLTKYNIQAPFSGVLSEGNLQPGTMVRVGQKLGTLIKPGSYELEAAVSIMEANTIELGDSVLLTSDNYSGEWMGKVKRVSQHLDQGTQTLKVYISVSAPDLREGMYLKGHILSGGFENSFSVPRSLLIGKDHIYLVKDSILTLTQVDVMKVGENQVVVTGIEEGSMMLGQVFSGAYNGLKVSPQIKAEEK